MSCRRHGSKPTIALWMLVAIADVAILVATGGLVALVLIVASLVVVAGGLVAARRLLAPPKPTRLMVARQKVMNPFRDRERRRA